MKPVLCNYKKKSFMNGSKIQDLLFVLRRSKLFVILNIQRHILNNYASLTEGTLTTVDESFASPLFKDAATSVSNDNLTSILKFDKLKHSNTGYCDLFTSCGRDSCSCSSVTLLLCYNFCFSRVTKRS